jgi:two-component system NarL family response regulator
MAIRVAIAEDQRMVREALGTLLAREPDITVVGEAATGPEAIALAHAQRPDVLVLDIGLPGMDGIEVTRALRQRQPGIKVLALSAHNDADVVRRMLKAGAVGYVHKSGAVSELVRAIRDVMQDHVYLSPRVTRQALAIRSGGPEVPHDLLSRRERQVLALIAEGKRSSEIAARLHISVATVEVHRRNIMRKLGLHTVAELTRYAIREGLSSP